MRVIDIESLKNKELLTPNDSIPLRSRCIVLEPGEESGEHVSRKSGELIFVIDGSAKIWEEVNEKNVDSGKAVYISPNKKHNVMNNSSSILKYIYVHGE